MVNPNVESYIATSNWRKVLQKNAKRRQFTDYQL